MVIFTYYAQEVAHWLLSPIASKQASQRVCVCLLCLSGVKFVPWVFSFCESAELSPVSRSVSRYERHRKQSQTCESNNRSKAAHDNDNDNDNNE